MTAFAGVGIAIAALGLYGTLSYMVAQRTREMAVRLALGATAAQVTALVIERGAQIMMGGIVLGLGVALAVRRVIESQLFGVTALDVPSLLLAAVVVMGAAIFASAIPARRAMQINPIEALRTE